MELYYLWILLLAVCAFCTSTASNEFRGSSANTLIWLNTVGLLGYVLTIASLVAAFFYTTWWHIVIIIFLIPVIVSFFGKIAKNGFVGMVCSVLIPILGILIYNQMINY